MGATYASFQLRDCSADAAEQGMLAFLDSLRASRPPNYPPATGVAVQITERPWRAVFPEEMYAPSDVSRFAATTGLGGVYLECADSDSWNFVAFAGGRVTAQLGDPASSVVDALHRAFGVALPANEIAAILVSKPLMAEAAMEQFARRLGIETSLNSYGLIRQGQLAGLSEHELRVITPPPTPLVADAELDVYLYSWVRGALPDDALATDLIDWVAHAVDSNVQWLARARPSNEGGGPALPSEEIDGIDGDESQLGRVRSLAAEGRLASLDIFADDVRLTYKSANEDHHTVLMRAPELLSPDGASRAPKLAALMLGADPALHRRLFANFRSWYGFVMPVPAQDDRGELSRLIAWPPFGHWLDYLSGGLVEQCGGRTRVERSLSGHTLTWNGSLIAQLPAPVYRALEPALHPCRENIQRLIAEAAQ